MRITKEHVRKLASEAERITGREILNQVYSPGDGCTRYVMTESMISTYKGARAATAYLLGVLSGSAPGGPASWVETRPGWIADIDAAYRFGQIPAACIQAFASGTAYGRNLRRHEGTGGG